MKHSFLAGIVVSGLAMATLAVSAHAQITDRVGSSAQLETAIHDYILAHPEVVLESVKSYDTHQKEVAQQKVRDNVRAHLQELTTSSPTAGKQVASPVASASPVTVVEFFDYRCGFCKKAAATVAGLEKMPGVRIVYKDLPILGGDSLLAAQAALAAGKQGAYDKLHNSMLAFDAPLTAASIDDLAGKAGLDVARLKRDMLSQEINAEIAKNEELAQKLEIQATPTFVVGDQLASGALTTQAFQALIDAARQQAGAVAKVDSPTLP